jgi:uncharacterized protein YbaP (TraB family)
MKEKIMKSRLFVLIMLLVSSLTNIFSAPRFKKTSENNFIWKVKGAHNTVYVLGSVHMLPKSVYPLHQNIEKAYTDCDVVVVEADISNVNAGKLQQKIMQRGFYTGSKTIKDDLSPELYAKLEEYLEKEPMLAIDQVKRLKPWYAGMTIAGVKMMKMGMQSGQGLDLYFLNKAHKEQKKVMELESGEFQINLLSGLKMKTQQLFLESSLEEMTDEKKKIENMINYWLNGNVEGIDKEIVQESYKEKEMRPLHKLLFDDRNDGMTKKILRYLKDKSGKNYLVIAGAGHLVGKTGIIKQLKDNGYNPVQL